MRNSRLMQGVAIAVFSTALVASAGCGSAKCNSKAAACSGPKCVSLKDAACGTCTAKKAEACTKCVPGGAACAKCEAKAGVAGSKDAEIDTLALATLLGSAAKVVVLDARSGKYDDGRRIPGAKTLSPGATADQAAAHIPSKDALVVTYCSNLQCPASRMLAKRLKSLGYENVLEYPKGIAGWAEDGQPIE